MLFKISLKNFVMHMVDYFTKEELLSFVYIPSHTIPSTGLLPTQVRKILCIEPSSQLRVDYINYGNRNMLKESFYQELDNDIRDIYNLILKGIIEEKVFYILVSADDDPIRKIYDNTYNQIFCEYLYDRVKLPVIDLNLLFSSGKNIETIRFDIDKIYKKYKTIRSQVKKEFNAIKKQSSHGRAELLHFMNKKEKMDELRKMDIVVDDNITKEELDELMINQWVKDALY